ncbi:MAG TPA: hypothetical protein DIT89_14530 [Planctomycetaceae bacterium]|nr:hypothetical protein [Planctomycetaceae bacterium]
MDPGEFAENCEAGEFGISRNTAFCYELRVVAVTARAEHLRVPIPAQARLLLRSSSQLSRVGFRLSTAF